MGKGHCGHRPGILCQVLIHRSIVARGVSEVEVKDDVKTEFPRGRKFSKSGIMLVSI